MLNSTANLSIRLWVSSRSKVNAKAQRLRGLKVVDVDVECEHEYRIQPEEGPMLGKRKPRA